MVFNEWDKQRAKLNHSWLLNRFITFLKAEKDSLNLFQQDWYMNSTKVEQLLDWYKRKNAIHNLISHAEAALSPRQLLYQHPLNRLSEDKKAWLADVCHVIYLQHSSVIDTVKKLESTIQELDDLVGKAVAHIKGEAHLPHNLGDALLQKATELSAYISAFPHAIPTHFGDQ